jgi:hypothetical protein
MNRVTVYVDGFNLYYGLKRMMAKDSEWKRFYWIDLVKFFDHFMGNGQRLHKVVYFTTPPMNIQKRNRQGLLLKANQLLNGSRFEVIEGKFYEKEVICPICGNKYTIPEEKRTDVNISAQMMRDCALNNTDVLILVSADSDLVPPLELVKNDYPEKTVKIFFPPKSFSYDLNGFIISNKGKVTLLKNHKIRFTNSIMPDVVTKDGKTYVIPPKWKV